MKSKTFVVSYRGYVDGKPHTITQEEKWDSRMSAAEVEMVIDEDLDNGCVDFSSMGLEGDRCEASVVEKRESQGVRVNGTRAITTSEGHS